MTGLEPFTADIKVGAILFLPSFVLVGIIFRVGLGSVGGTEGVVSCGLLFDSGLVPFVGCTFSSTFGNYIGFSFGFKGSGLGIFDRTSFNLSLDSRCPSSPLSN